MRLILTFGRTFHNWEKKILKWDEITDINWLRLLLGYTGLICYVFGCSWIWTLNNIDLWFHFLLLGDDNMRY